MNNGVRVIEKGRCPYPGGRKDDAGLALSNPLLSACKTIDLRTVLRRTTPDRDGKCHRDAASSLT